MIPLFGVTLLLESYSFGFWSLTILSIYTKIKSNVNSNSSFPLFSPPPPLSLCLSPSTLYNIHQQISFSSTKLDSNKGKDGTEKRTNHAWRLPLICNITRNVSSWYMFYTILLALIKENKLMTSLIWWYYTNASSCLRNWQPY